VETPPRRPAPGTHSLRKPPRQPKRDGDPYGSHHLGFHPPIGDYEEEEEEEAADLEVEDKENWEPPKPRNRGLPPRLQKKLEDVLNRLLEDLGRDLGSFYSTLEIPQCLF